MPCYCSLQLRSVVLSREVSKWNFPTVPNWDAVPDLWGQLMCMSRTRLWHGRCCVEVPISGGLLNHENENISTMDTHLDAQAMAGDGRSRWAAGIQLDDSVHLGFFQLGQFMSRILVFIVVLNWSGSTILANETNTVLVSKRGWQCVQHEPTAAQIQEWVSLPYRQEIRSLQRNR